ncbi:PfkB family carbohydrate kinase [Brachybacterium sp. JHP9]|uniref:pyridoxal kinase n=1 Tax=Brachybacterium equifaecis TaxID=2910770 RepID=A0ABT0QZT7_9MICO|nr:PfkB family carbohydrate kinase [Brachybacterium equifaecis]MCL6423167.1 PfkB family carbohydrate kinase [Brachybacterium equifaecis]
MPRPVLAIAGSESTGGAGAQTDLKTFHQLGVFGLVSLTCIVSFDPEAGWSHRFVPIDPQVIADQIETATAAHDIDTVKIGMLGTEETIDVVADSLRSGAFRTVVLDPVLVCKEGETASPAARTDGALIEKILPLATFVTPNHGEAKILSGMEVIETPAQLAEAARIIHERSGAVVLAKGGVEIAGEDAVDVFCDGEQLVELREPKIGEHRVTGAGCTLAAAITAELAKGAAPLEAARIGKAVVTSAIAHRQSTHAGFDLVYQGAYRT